MLAIWLQRYFVSQGITVLLSLVISVILSVVGTQIMEYILFDLITKFYWLRVLLDSRAKVEGIWIEIIEDQQGSPYAIVHISYNSSSKNYIIDGRVYGQDYKENESFKAWDINFDIEHNRIIYTYVTKKYNIESDTFGVTIVDFVQEGLRYTSSRGQFMDSGADYTRRAFSQKLLLPQEIYKLIGKENIETPDDAQALIIKYDQLRKSCSKSTDLDEKSKQSLYERKHVLSDRNHNQANQDHKYDSNSHPHHE